MDIKPENYILIQGFMITELGLKGTELLLYALIYGFTQDDETEFSGSWKYMCDWTNCRKPTVSSALLNLVEKGYIIKRSERINGVLFNRYKISWGVVKKLYWGGKETLLGGGKETLPNNTSIYNTNDKTIKEIHKESAAKQKNSVKTVQEEFEERWKMYPRKLGKDKALSAYMKARKESTPRSLIEEGLKRYLRFISTNKVNEKYIKHGATWFNQKCWEDDYTVSEYQAPDSAYDISNW
jgi:hypothetical protein